MAIGHAVVYYDAQAAQTLSAGIKCRHCRRCQYGKCNIVIKM